MTREMILRTIRMAEMRDPTETGTHVNRVAGYAVEIYETWASRNGISPQETQHGRDILRMAAMLHDVGKVAIPDNILKKPAKLDEEEFAVMKQHTWRGHGCSWTRAPILMRRRWKNRPAFGRKDRKGRQRRG